MDERPPRTDGDPVGRLLIASASLALLVSVSPFAALDARAVLFPDYTAVYTFNDATQQLSFSSVGTLTSVPTCSAAWQDLAPTQIATTNATHMEDFSVSTTEGLYIHDVQASLTLTTTKSVCGGIVGQVSVNADCSFSSDVAAPDPGSSFSALPPSSGWSTMAGSFLNHTTLAPNQLTGGDRGAEFVPLSLEVKYNSARAMHSTYGVPITGRVLLADPQSSHQPDEVRSGDYYAGRCPNTGAPTTGSFTSYDVSAHNFRAGARPGSGYAIPGSWGPIGQWQTWVDVCNSNC